MNNRTIKSNSALITLLTFALFSIASAQTPAANQQSDVTHRVDQLFARFDRPDSPGCALGVVKDGKLIYKKGYGMANLEHDIPISPSTVFNVASASTQFTAMSVLLLARQGKLQLEDDVRKYLPELPAYQATITIRQLIHHTSGVRDRIDLIAIAGGDADEVYKEDDIIELLARQKETNFKPGSQRVFSNSGYALLAAIVKRASGKSLRQFANENIFNPLGMSNTGFQDEGAMIVKNRAADYLFNNEGGFQMKASNVASVGDGGLFTTVEDLFLWDQNFSQDKLGGPELINQFLTPATLDDGEKTNYAFGLAVDNYKGLKTIAVGSDFLGYRAELLRFPDQKFSVICLCNFNRVGPNSIARQVADIYLADQFKPQGGGEGQLEKAKYIQMTEQELKDKTGVYLDAALRRFWTLDVEDGKLAVSATNGMRFRIAPVSATEFREFEVPVRIDVRFQNRGEGERPLMHLSIDRQKSYAFEPVKFVVPTPAEFAEYAGEYYSDEVQASYKIGVENGRLVATARRGPKFVLAPALKDEFLSGGFNFDFTRDPQNKVNGFLMDTDRSINVRFAKRK
jgi:CubicO group peptidase (beta-lactamase class C family)